MIWLTYLGAALVAAFVGFMGYEQASEIHGIESTRSILTALGYIGLLLITLGAVLERRRS